MTKVIKDNSGTVLGVHHPYEEFMYMNVDTGELLTLKEARKQFRDEYDGFDDTNVLNFDDKYMYIGA